MKLFVEIDLDQIVLTDGINGIGSSIANILRDSTLCRLGPEPHSGDIYDFDISVVGKWKIL